jgi:hypothetical protein
METTVLYIQAVQAILELCLTISGFILAYYIYKRDKRREALKTLSKEIIAYSAEEEEAVKWICELQDTDKTRSVLIELKNRAEQSKSNTYNVRPTYKETSVADYLK